ncbi:MAG: HAD-IIA family hydrolase [Chloroflexi bacterium]|nr:HAD-IIA family hydrolase [Chloroflexota bacterium]
MTALPDRIRLVIFDLDGVVYRGSTPVQGASELVASLHRRGTLVRFATNNSMVARAGYVDRLASMGIETTTDEIVTSTSATVAHLRRHEPGVRSVLGVGADGMERELTDVGLSVTMVAAAVPEGYAGGSLADRFDAVIVGLDPTLDYAQLGVAMRAVADGAKLIATNADARYPTAEGFLPGAGSLVAALSAATGIEPEVIGKPSPAMFEAILESAGVSPDEAVVVGDNPDADIVGARRAGCGSILVLTGVADADHAASLDGERRPDAVAENPGAVWALLEPRLS